MTKKTYILPKMMTVSLTHWFLVSFVLSTSVYVAIMIMAKDKFEKPFIPLVCAFALILTGLLTLRNAYQKDVRIEVLNNETLAVYFGDKLKLKEPIAEMTRILTMARDSVRNDVRAEINFPKKKINIYDNHISENKKAFDDFLLYLEKKQKFAFVKAPFLKMLSKQAVIYYRKA
ncbi:MAG: hypothetical protein LBQ97_00585 [Fusobacteriaceae bacterium]|nr:hypothetical protein [Fusobacteriaceae bacterium]